MTGWDLKLWRKSMCWSRERAAREMGVSLRTWHTWENSEQVDVIVGYATQAVSIRDLLPAMHKMRKSDLITRLEKLLEKPAAAVTD
ncbi:TPA: helix-turn-helix transcriptional regulator [Salmonella enterica]|uniref:Helix-turn-helix transcriptional regulator n=3 Tax=Salmonella enterica TaxID=28901 RepID=A0A754E952_SALER|nr:helix-turn-helix transcriptional regulator [Salmonella enterica]EBX2707465.1 XRE family transcriptional regulator [Salmonella enterica subsp. enterica serovar Bredeney]ECC3917818.1 XRE family transcriptional regulator [Salmonella enterica subsp. diarizonae]ECU9162561.1 XRE family transcriptional regulator [Salmonella enterica subsp. enterica serovar Newport str. CFSAN000599]EDN5730483.1 helix-turn-helix transcriptional regulator [Salmonella enterica subsp. enterica serovar Ajiobo]EDU1196645